MKARAFPVRVLLFLGLVLVYPASLYGSATVHHALSVRLNPKTGTVACRDRITGLAAQGQAFTLAEGMVVDQLAVGGKPVPVRSDAGRWLVPATGAEEGEVEVEYHGRVETGESTVALPAGSGWVPTFDDELVTYDLEVTVPDGLLAVAPGKIVAEEKTDAGYRARFASNVPGEGISLFAGPYAMRERMHGRLRLRTYLHAEVADLADLYLSKTAGYIDLYEKEIGAYPYSAFYVVSAVNQVGLGFPGLTYMGTHVLRLPFIPDTSLGHEVLHTWWGNGVFIDVSQGNWAEGLTTFMADYAFAERKGPKAALEMRLRWLREYAALPPESERPLTSFRSRQHTVSQAVGYHKAAMVFLMLRDELGREVFQDGIRRFWKSKRFRAATWHDLQLAFEAAAGTQLDSFFSQWIERAGAPELRIGSASRRKAEDGYEVAVDLKQKEPVYRLDVPVEIETVEGTIPREVRLDTAESRLTFRTSDLPIQFRVDPNFRVFRRLDPREFPPILRNVAFAARPIAVIAAADSDARDAARAVAADFFERVPEWSDANATVPPGPVLIVGTRSELAPLLARNELPETSLPAEGSARVWAARRTDQTPYVVVEGDDAEALRQIAGPLPHYGSRSYVVFRGRSAVARGVWPVTGSPLQVRLDDRS